METITLKQVDNDGNVIDETKVNLHQQQRPAKLFVQTDEGIICCLRFETGEDGAIKTIKVEEYK